ncbi:SNARE-complex protein Syntaxin-18 N-terminal [Artemisia annua]|uniref:SNARE-complex protein Syntaxin-18 N-terminal n=1 Tax=Artemisia annua TaxID=35608 RepID=A0A2U1L4R9_ARTAN|nr:SNARE-complex protein Syntaxin-18 N-terminal [Artemisia annua]
MSLGDIPEPRPIWSIPLKDVSSSGFEEAGDQTGGSGAAFVGYCVPELGYLHLDYGLRYSEFLVKLMLFLFLLIRWLMLSSDDTRTFRYLTLINIQNSSEVLVVRASCAFRLLAVDDNRQPSWGARRPSWGARQLVPSGSWPWMIIGNPLGVQGYPLGVQDIMPHTSIPRNVGCKMYVIARYLTDQDWIVGELLQPVGYLKVETFFGHISPISSWRFSTSGDKIASASVDGTMLLELTKMLLRIGECIFLVEVLKCLRRQVQTPSGPFRSLSSMMCIVTRGQLEVCLMAVSTVASLCSYNTYIFRCLNELSMCGRRFSKQNVWTRNTLTGCPYILMNRLGSGIVLLVVMVLVQFIGLGFAIPRFAESALLLPVLILSEKLHSVTSQFDQLRAVHFQEAINRAMPRRKPKRALEKTSTDISYSSNSRESRESTSSERLEIMVKSKPNPSKRDLRNLSTKYNEVENESRERLKELEESQVKIPGLHETIERSYANLSNLESENQVLHQEALVASTNEDLTKEAEMAYLHKLEDDTGKEKEYLPLEKLINMSLDIAHRMEYILLQGLVNHDTDIQCVVSGNTESEDTNLPKQLFSCWAPELLLGSKHHLTAIDIRSLDETQQHLATWAKQYLKKGKLKKIIYPELKGQMSQNCLNDYAKIVECYLSSNPQGR